MLAMLRERNRSNHRPASSMLHRRAEEVTTTKHLPCNVGPQGAHSPTRRATASAKRRTRSSTLGRRSRLSLEAGTSPGAASAGRSDSPDRTKAGPSAGRVHTRTRPGARNHRRCFGAACAGLALPRTPFCSRLLSRNVLDTPCSSSQMAWFGASSLRSVSPGPQVFMRL